MEEENRGNLGRLVGVSELGDGAYVCHVSLSDLPRPRIFFKRLVKRCVSLLIIVAVGSP